VVGGRGEERTRERGRGEEEGERRKGEKGEGRGRTYHELPLAGGFRLGRLGFGLLRGTLFVRVGWVVYRFGLCGRL